jgi:DNA modification methylase
MSATLHLADARRAPLADASVDLVVTSPPYFGMRDYGSPDEIGIESTPAEYAAEIIKTLAEMRRLLKPGGSVFLVIGDKYARTGGVDRKVRGGAGEPGGRAHARQVQRGVPGVPDKSLIGLPYRVALAAIDEGWWWRQEIVWHKPNPLPESVRDRCQRSHETILHLTPTPRYYAAPGVRESDVWTFAVQGYRDPFGRKHPAVFPLGIPRRCIDMYCPPGGTVLDPFAGSGTTLVAAVQSGRTAIGLDLNTEYLDVARTRLENIA